MFGVGVPAVNRGTSPRRFVPGRNIAAAVAAKTAAFQHA
jgi:hypothetical protein